MNKYTGMEIAIIGMAGKFPGAGNTVEFWQNLKNGTESIRPLSDEEILQEGEDEAVLRDPAYIKASAFVEDKEYFDAAFFGYRPEEAGIMNPQLRMFHEICWSALEDAGYNTKDNKEKIGLFAGAASNFNWEAYALLANRDNLVDNYTASQLRDVIFLCSRISYLLDLQGPSLFINTACSTSLVAVQKACMSLLLRECTMALAGGITLQNHSRKGYMYREGMINSMDGHCRTFDKDASGTVGGEGAGVVVLKRLEDALKDGDHIWAVIKGSAVNNDGNQKVSFTAPSVDGQYKAIVKAMSMAGVPSSSISYVEAHGTGTRLGDPVEVEALKHAFGKSEDKYCALGSVKTNIGHLDVAAGVAGLIKTVLCLKHRQLPASLHFRTANPEIGFEGSPFYVNNTLRDWHPQNGYPLRAGVSSFGIGGTNAHIILEEAPAPVAGSASRAAHLLLLSGHTPASLQGNIERLKAYLETHENASLADLSYTLQTGRTPLAYRTSVVCSNREEAISQLSGLTPVKEGQGSKVVFMFPGQGTQYAGMCEGLYANEPVFKATADACFEIVQSINGKDLKAIIFSHTREALDETANTQPALFIMEYALSRLLLHWGIEPDLMIGHSIGEYVAACLSGVFKLEDALQLVVKRGELMQSAPRGSMLGVPLSLDAATVLLSEHEGIWLAAVNGPELCTLSGETEAIASCQATLESRGYRCRALQTSHGFHSGLMDTILPDFLSAVQSVELQAPTRRFISNVTGKAITAAQAVDPQYWVDHLRHTVLFSEGIKTLLEEGEAVFVEVGPGKVLSTLAGVHGAGTTVSLLSHGADTAQLLAGLGKLWESGVVPSWERFYEEEHRLKVSLPTYAFEKVKYPVNVNAVRLIERLMAGGGQKLELPELSTTPAQLIEQEGTASTQETLKTLWQNFFGKKEIAVEDDFFNLGGDSLKALTMIGRIHQVCKVKIGIKEFFSSATIAQLAAYIDALQGTEVLSIPEAPAKPYYALSSAQKRLYFLHELNSTSLAYNLPQFLEMEGEPDLEKLTDTFNRLVERHESLRTSFGIMEDVPVQKIAPHASLHIACYDDEEAIKDFSKPFDLSVAPLMRVGLIRTAPGKHILMVDIHHIITDGVSQSILIKEFMALYSGQALPVLKLQYKDYAEWQQGALQQAAVAEQKDFWLKVFSRPPAILELPTDFARPSVTSHAGNAIGFHFSSIETEKLKELAAKEGVTMFMMVLALYNVLLAKLANQEDVVVGIPAAGRRHAALENLMGILANTLPIRNTPKGALSFSAFLQNVKSGALTSFDNQDYPYEELIDDLKLERSAGHNPLFDVAFSYENFEEPDLRIPGLTLRRYSREHTSAKFDITLMAVEHAQQLLCYFEYATDLFSKHTIHRFIDLLKHIVEQVTDDPQIRLSDIQMMNSREKEQFFREFNHTGIIVPETLTVVNVFESRVKETPDAVAVLMNGATITYRQLNEKANRIAHLLISKGVVPDTIVAMFMDRSIDLIAGIYGILKAGGAYLPIDIESPADKVLFLLSDCQVSLVLTTTDLEDKLDPVIDKVLLDSFDGEEAHSEDPGLIIQPQHLCYIIYTSGTTGRPKGVMVEHGNLSAIFFNKGFLFDFSTQDVWTMFHRYSFDFSVWEIFGALVFGGKLVIISRQDSLDPAVFLQILKEQQVTVLNQTPTAFNNLMLKEQEDVVPQLDLRYVIFGGEALSPKVLRTWRSRYPMVKLVNMYGITETTIHVTYKEITAAEIQAGNSNIGKPLPTVSGYILDAHLNMVPAGFPGQLFVGGKGVTRGYVNDVELTHRKFLNNPYQAGDRLYRTGDQARLMPDGELEYKGRIDNQVQLKGFRIELGEIENALTAYRFIKEARVVYKEREAGAFLAAYYIADTEIETQQLRKVLSQSLPLYMVPACFIRIEQIPLTANGKVDLKGLPEPVISMSADYLPPATTMEKALEEVWMEVLGLLQAGINSNYFALGGDSIMAIRLVTAINKRLARGMKVVDLYNHQTIQELAAFLEEAHIGEDNGHAAWLEADEELQQFHESYMANTADERIEWVYPMSNIEKAMCFIHLKDPQDVLYYEQLVWPVYYENFNTAVLEQALQLLAAKHPALRTAFNISAFAHIIYKEEAISVNVSYTDITHLDSTQQEAWVKKAMENSRKDHFELEKAPLWKTAVHRLDTNHHLVIFEIHHAISDGWSIATFVNELNNTYRELLENSRFTPARLKSSYRDFIIAEMIYRKQGQHLDYWKKEMADFRKFSFGAAPAREKHYRSKRIPFTDELYSRLETVAAGRNSHVKNIFFAAYMYTLKQMSYENDIVVGLVTFNRSFGEDAGNLFGNFLNTIPVRMVLNSKLTGTELLDLTDRKLLEIKMYDKTSLFDINEAAGAHEFGANPITDTLFNFTNFHSSYELTLEKVEKEGKAELNVHNYIRGHTLFDMNINGVKGRSYVQYEYVTSFIDDHLLEEFHRIYSRTLNLLADSSEGPLNRESMAPLLIKGPERKAATGTIIELWETAISHQPALLNGERILSHAELHNKVNSLAALISTTGAARGQVIAVATGHSFEMVTGILAVLKAGCTYLPVDPGQPASRNAYMLEDADVKLVLTQTRFASSFRGYQVVDLENPATYEKGHEGYLPPVVELHDPAYIIYTSGSTGKPKGVLIAHGALRNYITWAATCYVKEEHVAFPLFTAFTFDLTVTSLFVPLITGNMICIYPDHADLLPLESMLLDNRVDVVKLTPSHLKLLRDLPLLGNPGYKCRIRRFIVGGEELPTQLANDISQLFNGEVEIYNEYGPTEATVGCMIYQYDPAVDTARTLSIGVPIKNSTVCIIDKNNVLLPAGIAGELCIAGDGLAVGYLNKAALTAEKFIMHLGERLYKTGDLARIASNGNVEYLGRIDEQVKIRGYRIELGEIENELLVFPGVNRAVLITKKVNGETVMSAFYTADEELSSAALKEHLRERLPAYMVPSIFVQLPQIPLNPNGKVDKEQLAALSIPDTDADLEEQPSELESEVARIWREILHVEQIGLHDSFFDVGGHSLNALTLVNRVHKEFNVNLSLKEVFSKSTVKLMAGYIDMQQWLNKGSDANGITRSEIII